ncbi:TNF receptor-associated factor 2-like isoform X2 [Narcine bancroftii]|uniref:TNF receptor-associated factor 2-like isoform X2 n=1 Tax=Narcine bancroftii TaxID=1343680 RepID=UPI0038312E48
MRKSGIGDGSELSRIIRGFRVLRNLRLSLLAESGTMVALVSGISPVDPIASSSLLCSACRFLLIKPKQTECGHRYCTACLENLFGTGNEMDCYICQKKVRRSKVYLDKAAENDANATSIRCTAHVEGCDWVGTLRNYLRTHRAQCGFYVLPCANVAFGCDIVGPRCQMLVHETQECEWRMERCPWCKAFCVHKLLEDHASKCRKQESCPLCGLTDLTEAELQRQDMDNHLQASQHSHLLLLLSLISSLRTGNGSLPQAGDKASSGTRAPDPSLSVLASQTDILERTVSGLNKELDRCTQVMEALQRRCLHYEQVIHDLQKAAKVAAEGPVGPAPSGLPVSTNGVLVWRIKDFSAHLSVAKTGSKPSFYSPHFTTHPFGYRMCCRIYPNGDGNGKGSHISLFLAIVRGEYDEVLPWPFRQRVTFLLLDQAGHRHLKESFSPDALSGSFQKPRSHMNVASGCPTFVQHELIHKGPCQYLRNDTLYIKVVVDLAGLQV